MNIAESRIDRKYECDNCHYFFWITEKIGDKWRKKCPQCKKNKLFLSEANTYISAFIDNSVPKTVGSLAEKNRQKFIKEGNHDLSKDIVTRKQKRKKQEAILKNPSRYIETGKT